MELKHKDNGEKGAFLFRDEGLLAAEMTYVWMNDNAFIIDHTEVSPLYERQGLGKQLVAGAVEFARGRGIKILPLCPFARAVFDKTPDYNDVRLTR
ncbi:GNAT family N-acetyltransferase [Proteiniphilum sp.]|uniref:GNAT family N-acetyltransferase n=1 Tax=Proteiniphilum sp. TaxID=1926877 RepID=UPI002B21407F|nr:GNAT family N-acetyltransferase [Proteiniphilum sp.]MEA5129538.1 GNAT family N-acetyltransferase [Proteiniphilum sp.]